MRARARRRLIGAAALLLAAVIVVPMILDPAPKPLPSNIPIDLPSEKSPFKPRLALPATPEPGNAPMVPPPDAESEAKAAKAPAASEAKPVAKPAEKAEKVEAGKATSASNNGRIYLQVAALGSDAAARELVQRLKKAGHAAIVEKVETKEGTRYRVRVGPFATREDAEQARAKLRAAGFQANAVNS
jgi:DedD protein